MSPDDVSPDDVSLDDVSLDNVSLDNVLASWASGVRLGDAEAGTIYQRIVVTPRPDLDPAWWREFTADCAGWIVRSNLSRMPAAAVAWGTA